MSTGEKKQPKSRFYSPIQPPRLSMTELVCKTLDHDATDVLIDKWLEHRNDAYWDWFMRVRERRHSALRSLRRGDQLLAWSKGDFVPENIFMRTVDTARLIPLDRTWTTHVYHHRSMQDRKLSMMPVVFTMVRGWYLISHSAVGPLKDIDATITLLPSSSSPNLCSCGACTTKAATISLLL
jgi:hypothetical protein